LELAASLVRCPIYPSPQRPCLLVKQLDHG
jgi:hypothetical protein